MKNILLCLKNFYIQIKLINIIYKTFLMCGCFITNKMYSSFKASSYRASELNFWEEISENLSGALNSKDNSGTSQSMDNLLNPPICADWMLEIANHISTGDPNAKKLNKKTKMLRPVPRNPQYLAIKENCEKMYQLQDLVAQKPNISAATDHLFYHFSSVPLTNKQLSALDEYLEAYKTQPCNALEQEIQNENEAMNEQTAQLSTNNDLIATKKEAKKDALKHLAFTMQNWDYKDFYDIIMLYKTKNDDYGAKFPPFVYWLSELVDLRTVFLPTPDTFAIVSALTPAFFHTFFYKYFPHIDYPETDIEEAEKSFLEMVFFLIKEDKLSLSHVQLALQNTLKEMLHGRTNVSERIRYFVDNLSDEIGVPAELAKSQKMKLEIENFAHELFLLENKLKQAHSAKKLLKNWNARNFELLGSADNKYHAHPVYGKMLPDNVSDVKKPYATLLSDDQLIPPFKQWDEVFYKHTFPANKFQLRDNLPGELESYEWINSSNATDMIVDFFNFMRKSFGDQATREYYSAISKFNFKIVSYDPITKALVKTPIDEDLSTILATVIATIDEQEAAGIQTIETKAAVYQALYQILLTIALADNKFAQRLLAYQFPIITTNNILDSTSSDEVQYNPLGFLLCHIRSVLIAIVRTSPEFIDFLTYYYETIDSEGKVNSTGQCRMSLDDAAETVDDFTTVLFNGAKSREGLNNPELKTYEPPASDKITWIMPFSLTEELKYLISGLYTISLYDISKDQVNTPVGMKLLKKQMTDKSALYMYVLPLSTDLTYYPAMTTKFLKYILEEVNQPEIDKVSEADKEAVSASQECKTLSTLQSIEASWKDKKDDLKRINRVMNALNMILAQSDYPDELKDSLSRRLCKEVYDENIALKTMLEASKTDLRQDIAVS